MRNSATPGGKNLGHQPRWCMRYPANMDMVFDVLNRLKSASPTSYDEEARTQLAPGIFRLVGKSQNIANFFQNLRPMTNR